jgi:hypothetical protein
MLECPEDGGVRTESNFVPQKDQSYNLMPARLALFAHPVTFYLYPLLFSGRAFLVFFLD